MWSFTMSRTPSRASSTISSSNEKIKEHGFKTNMDIGFQFKITYSDKDLFEVRISACNGVFGGGADVYVGINQLNEIAAKLEGFPRNPRDSRDVILGAFGPESAGVGVSMRFYCTDRSGHAYVESKIESGSSSGGTIQSVTLSLPI